MDRKAWGSSRVSSSGGEACWGVKGVLPLLLSPQLRLEEDRGVFVHAERVVCVYSSLPWPHQLLAVKIH